MLVLSRMRDQSVIVQVMGIEIEVTCVDIRGDKIRLGFQAPLSAVIHRKEVHEAIKRESRRQAGLHIEDIANIPPRQLSPKDLEE